MENRDTDWELSAENGDANAQFLIGKRTLEASKNFADEKAGVRALEAAAAQGHLEAQYLLGMCHEEGIGGAKNPRERDRWLEQAAAQDHPAALARLGCIREREALEDPSDIRWFALIQKSARLGDPVGQFILGYCYEHGRQVEQDYERAFKLYRASAAKKSPEALYRLGEWHLDGTHVKKNTVEALHYFERAADLGYAEALFQAGHCHDHGIGTVSNLAKALTFYKKAAARHELHAYAALKRIHLLSKIQSASLLLLFMASLLGFLFSDHPGNSGRQKSWCLFGIVLTQMLCLVGLFTSRIWFSFRALGGRFQFSLSELFQAVIGLSVPILMFYFFRAQRAAQGGLTEFDEQLAVLFLIVLIVGQLFGAATGYAFAQKQRLTLVKFTDEKTRFMLGVGALLGLATGLTLEIATASLFKVVLFP